MRSTHQNLTVWPLRAATLAVLLNLVPMLLTTSIASQDPPSIGSSDPLSASRKATTAQDGQSLAPYVPTPREVVDRMLQLAEIMPDDVVYDLGSGDGRIPISAARDYGARGVGVDIDPERIAEANANARREGVADRVTFVLGDALATDVSEASVVTLYLLSSSIMKLRPILSAPRKAGKDFTDNPQVTRLSLIHI